MFSCHGERASEGFSGDCSFAQIDTSQARLLSVGKGGWWVSKGLAAFCLRNCLCLAPVTFLRLLQPRLPVICMCCFCLWRTSGSVRKKGSVSNTVVSSIHSGAK